MGNYSQFRGPGPQLLQLLEAEFAREQWCRQPSGREDAAGPPSSPPRPQAGPEPTRGPYSGTAAQTPGSAPLPNPCHPVHGDWPFGLPSQPSLQPASPPALTGNSHYGSQTPAKGGGRTAGPPSTFCSPRSLAEHHSPSQSREGQARRKETNIHTTVARTLLYPRVSTSRLVIRRIISFFLSFLPSFFLSFSE